MTQLSFRSNKPADISNCGAKTVRRLGFMSLDDQVSEN